MEEREDIKKEIFNLTKDTVTVKEVAEICKKHNPKVTIKRNQWWNSKFRIFFI